MLVVSSPIWPLAEITGRLQAIGQDHVARAAGDRNARVAGGHRRDELGSWLATSMGCWTITQQRCQPERWLKTIADKSLTSSSGALRHERDGVVILNEDGSVFGKP